jgi:hypothetical protein
MGEPGVVTDFGESVADILVRFVQEIRPPQCPERRVRGADGKDRGS